MKYFISILILLVTGTDSLFAQLSKSCDNIIIPQYSLPANSVWPIADSLGMDFNTPGGPVAVPTFLYRQVNNLGSSSVSDSNGQLLFYTNGNTVWSANGSIMLSQVSGGLPLIVGVPFQPGKYYLLTSGYDLSLPTCNVIDMSVNNGSGGVVESFPLSFLPTIYRSWIAAADCSGNAWLLLDDVANPRFWAYRITSAGIDSMPVVSDFTGVLPPLAIGSVALSISPNGKHIARTASGFNNPSKISYYDFDPQTGVVSNPRLLKSESDESFAAPAFSPDGSKLYCLVTTSAPNYHRNILQYDLSAPLPDSLIEPDSAGWALSSLRLGPDGKIYFVSQLGLGNAAVGRINYPNNTAASCGFQATVTSVDFSSLPASGTITIPFLPPAVIPQSSLGISVQLQGDTLVAQPDIFDSYQWYLNGSLLAYGNTASLAVSDTGLYAVKVVDSTCGCSDSAWYHISGSPDVGIAPMTAAQIRVYPNPAHQEITILSPIPLALSLYDLTGRLLCQSKGSNQLEIAGLSTGVYLLRIEDLRGRFVMMKKVVKRGG